MRRLRLPRWGLGFGCMGGGWTGSIVLGWWLWRCGPAGMLARFRPGILCAGAILACSIGCWCGLPRLRRATCC